MNISIVTPLLRMLERSLIVAGGILSIYLGYKLFVLGIDKSQGAASAFGVVELKNFGPGLFFAALGAVILVTTMRAAVKVGSDAGAPAVSETETQAAQKQAASTAVFFGMEDSRQAGKGWTETAFFLDTRQLLRRLDKGEAPDTLTDLRSGLKGKLDSITMSAAEYVRFQELSRQLPLDERQQRELIILERKLFP